MSATADRRQDIDLDRCPACGRFVEVDADGYYDAEERGYDPDDPGYLAAFCDERCADRYHGRRRPA